MSWAFHLWNWFKWPERPPRSKSKILKIKINCQKSFCGGLILMKSTYFIFLGSLSGSLSRILENKSILDKQRKKWWKNKYPKIVLLRSQFIFGEGTWSATELILVEIRRKKIKKYIDKFTVLKSSPWNK